MSILINTTVLSNFAATGRLDLLPALYGTVFVAYPVYEELQQGLEEGYTFLANIETHISPFHPKGWLHLVMLEGEEELTLYQTFPAKLHRGEAASLAIAAHRNHLFLSDDQAARRYANKIGVSVSGTLGVLVQLIRRKLLTIEEANKLLKQMIVKAKYHSPVTDLRLLLKSNELDMEDK